MSQKSRGKGLCKLPRFIWLILLGTLTSCTTIKIPNVEWCASAGHFGALCQYSMSDDNRSLTTSQWIEFLDAQTDDPKTETNEEKSPALCISSKDFVKVKTVIDQMCDASSGVCRKDEIQQIFFRLKRLFK